MTPSIPSTAITKFAMTSAPVGWTQITSYNDHALRVTSGTASTGGTAPYTTAFSSKTASGVNNISLATTGTAAPSQTHNHTAGASGVTGHYSAISSRPGQPGTTPMWIWPGATNTYQTGSNGSGATHSHTVSVPAAVNSPVTGSTLNFSLRYVDVIIAQRN